MSDDAPVATVSVQDVALIAEWFRTCCAWCYERSIELSTDEVALAQRLGIDVPTEEECL
ncbi:hypothetical protein CPT_Pepon008 [Stenotrophomonas phage Pepon]|uniref:Uncharacterized protein n=1 Tax=Stenotrophomonas phage Pepon TaxID=2859654 RepID=A0AAE7WPC4_9CAUD|nr:hypothetical protein CPT_Pepon008 [Stenotrophomonas phage Pepon]